MKKSGFIFLLLTICIPLSAQMPDTIWTKTYGDSSYDGASDIIQKSDNGFIITGSIGTQLAPNVSAPAQK
jgi:hypothetical protein